MHSGPELNSRAAEAIGEAEFAAALDLCRTPAPFALAVSGGPDSMALMHLAAHHCRVQRLAPPCVYTVDHKLRKASADEALMVAETAGNLGLKHRTLVWEGRKPRENLQHAARMARYALMGEALRQDGLWAVLTGHTQDDQAETFVMRLARGSGLDGLSGMAPVAAFPMPTFADLCVLRPLLAFSKARILATIRAFDAPFAEDPSNQDPIFLRVRARRALSALAETGITPQKIADATAHLRRARAAIEQAEAALFAAAVEVDPWGAAIVAPAAMRDAPQEVGLRLTSTLLRMASGSLYAPEMPIVEGVYRWLTGPEDAARGRTAGGCRLVRVGVGLVLVAREQAGLDADEPVLLLRPGESGVWDGRFRVTIGRGAMDGTYCVQALGDFAQSALRHRGFSPARFEPRRLAAAYPGVFVDGVLQAPPAPSATETAPFAAQFLGRTPHPPDI